VSFTIKCDKCGNEQTFKNYNSEWKQIQVIVNTRSSGIIGYPSEEVDEVSIWCENPQCNHSVDIKY
jgi:hypothetical protein